MKLKGHRNREPNAPLHDFVEVLIIALLSIPPIKQTCANIAYYAVADENFLREFMRLERGLSCRDTDGVSQQRQHSKWSRMDQSEVDLSEIT